jgi:uncharacterized protein (DUF885 family)
MRNKRAAAIARRVHSGHQRIPREAGGAGSGDFGELLALSDIELSGLETGEGWLISGFMQSRTARSIRRERKGKPLQRRRTHGLISAMKESDSRRFEGVMDRFFETMLEDNPILAAMSGLEAGEGKLGDAGMGFEDRQEKRRRKALASLDMLSPRELSGEQHLDRLALRNLLLQECEDHSRDRAGLDPNALDRVLGITLHELQRGDHDPARAARNLRGLVRDTPSYLAESMKVVKRPDPVWRRIMEQTFRGSDSLWEAVGVFLARHQPAAGDGHAIAAARRAFRRYRDKVNGMEAAPAGAFAVGSAVMQRRVRDQLGLDYTLEEIEALARSEVRRVGGLLEAECARFGRGRTAAGIIAEARRQWNPEGKLIDHYRSETTRVAAAFKAAGAVTFPKSESLEVRPVPDFMRHLLPTAAYSSPGAFARRQRGVFWVNDLSETKTSPAEQLAERQQHFGLSLTCAHEGYPGHHLQFVTANRHPRRWRRLFAHAVFYEGWTLWCEQMMVDLSVGDSPWLKVQQLHDAMWRCHRILVDLRLQTGRYSYEMAVRHLQRHLGTTRARAEADVNWYTGSPGVPMSYWLGRLENERLRRRLMDGRKWSLRRFNDWLLSFGTLPQSWIEKYGLD